jgi:hypothetical protein
LHSIRYGHWKIVFEIGADRYSMLSGLTSQHPCHFAGPTTEALHRPEPQKSIRRLRESINITWDTTWCFAYANRTSEIVHEEKPLARVRLRFPQKTSGQSPGLMVFYFRFILAFLEEQLGNFSRNSLETAAQAEISTLYPIEGPRSIRLAHKIQF